MTKKYTIGVDPGSPLTMTMLNPAGMWVAHAGGDVVANKAKVGWLNCDRKVTGLLRQWQRHANKGGVGVAAVIENVGPMPGEGIVSACKFAGSIWLVKGILTALDIPYTMTTPQEWKRGLKLTRDKGASVDLARTLFPDKAWRVKRKKDHDFAEAALLAHYHQTKT